MNSHIRPVELEKAYRLINHGPTVLVSACHDGIDDVMAASWCCALDFAPAKLTVVLDKSNKTRDLIEKSGRFVIQVPTAGQIRLVHHVGSHSLNDSPDKLTKAGVTLFQAPGSDLPLVAGCSAWLLCDLLAEPHNQQTHDLFIGTVHAAWADDRVFRDGRWDFQSADPSWRSLHYVAGGQFYAIGQSLTVDTGD